MVGGDVPDDLIPRNKTYSPFAPVTPTSACRASPGPLTTQPMTAIFTWARISRNSFSTALASSMEFTVVRPQVGQEITSIPRPYRSSERNRIFAVSTSSMGSAVSDTRIVSPMPSKSNAPMPMEDFTVPDRNVPASVTPRCRG